MMDAICEMRAPPLCRVGGDFYFHSGVRCSLRLYYIPRRHSRVYSLAALISKVRYYADTS